MAIRLQQTIYDDNGQAWTIKVHDTEYASTVVPINIVAARVQYQPLSRDKHSPILSSIADLTFRIDSATLQNFVSDFKPAPERQFRLQIDKGSSLFWVGLMLNDNVIIEDKERPFRFTVRATDGLGTLKDIDYNNDGDDYEGKERNTEHIVNCLNKIGTADLFSNLLSTAVSWYSNDHSSTSIDPFHLSRFDHRRFIKIETSGKKIYTKCYDVIKQICEAWGARILLTDGTFKVIQVNEYEGANFTLFNYDDQAALDSTTAAATYRETDATDVLRIFGGSFQYLPAIRRSIVTYKHFQSQSLIPPDAIGTATYTLPDVDSGGGTSTLLLSVKYKYGSTFPAGFETHRHKFRFEIKIGTRWLKRTASINSAGAVSYAPNTWENTQSYYEFFTGLIIEDIPSNYSETPLVLSPAIPEDGDLEITASYVDSFDEQGASLAVSYTPSISWHDAYLEIVVAGALESRSNQTFYQSSNTETENTALKEVSTIIGDAPSLNALGALEVFDGTNWIASTGWGVANVSGSDKFGQILAQELILTQYKPTEVINATYSGTYTPLQSIFYSSKDYMPLSVTIDLIRGKSNGEFVEISSTGASVTDEDLESSFEVEDERLSPRTPTPSIEDLAPSEDTPFTEAIVEQFRVFKTRTSILTGATVTSIPIDAATDDDIIKSGDVIELIHGVTGQSQSFTVSADVATADDIISVNSATADFDFTVDSAIVVSQEEVLKKINTSTGGGGQVDLITTTAGLDNSGTSTVNIDLNLSELTTLSNPSGADYLAGYKQSTGANATWQLYDLVHSILASADSSVTITTNGSSVDLEVNFPLETVNVGTGLDVTGTTTRTISFDLSELSLSTGYDYNDFLVGTTSTGTESRTNVLDMFANMITAGTNVTVTNTGTAIEIAASGGASGVSTITTSTGLDNSGTTTVDISLDLSELTTTTAVGGEYFVVGTTSAGSEVKYTIQNLLLDSLIAGTGITIASSGNDVEISASGGGGGMTDWVVRGDNGLSQTITDGYILDVDGGNGIETRVTGGDLDILLDGSSLISLGAIDGDHEIWVFDDPITGRVSLVDALDSVLDPPPSAGNYDPLTITKNGNELEVRSNIFWGAWSGSTDASGYADLINVAGVTGCIVTCQLSGNWGNIIINTVSQTTSILRVRCYTANTGAVLASSSLSIHYTMIKT